ncbi:MAG: tetratricopeptide repeat protein, partial [Archangium sp.]|nr:tetratricopeptide repeat protein [Archangium sp.]
VEQWSLQIKKSEDAVADLLHSIDYDPSYADAYRTLGYLYKDMKKTKLAIEVFKKYLEIKTDIDTRDKKQIEDELFDLEKGK